MTLKAPEHLFGKLGKHTPQELRDERDRWVAQARRDGYSLGDTARAIGLSEAAAMGAASRGGWTPPRLIIPSEPSRYGFRLGNIEKSVRSMPDEAQERLMAAVARSGKTMVQVLAEHWAAS